jgi:hypothetical protein
MLLAANDNVYFPEQSGSIAFACLYDEIFRTPSGETVYVPGPQRRNQYVRSMTTQELNMLCQQIKIECNSQTFDWFSR